LHLVFSKDKIYLKVRRQQLTELRMLIVKDGVVWLVMEREHVCSKIMLGYVYGGGILERRVAVEFW
jgi:hypothetical protein